MPLRDPESFIDRPHSAPIQHPESRGWSLFNPKTWFGGDASCAVLAIHGRTKPIRFLLIFPHLFANKPTPNATPEEAEVGGGGFRIPGTDQSIGFGDQTVTLKTGGTVVQSGNPLPVRIEKIDPTAGGVGSGVSGEDGSGGGGGSGGHGHWGGAARGAGGGKQGGDNGVPYVARSMTDGTGISQAQYDAFRAGIRDIEGGKYGSMGGAGGRYAGAYQMGPSEIREAAMRLKMDPNDAQKRFLSDPALQEKLFENYTREHYDQLMRDPAFAGLSTAEKLQVLATGQLGVRAAERYLHGNSTADAWGTPTSAWATAVKRRLRAVPPPTLVPPSSPMAGRGLAPGEYIGKDGSGRKLIIGPDGTARRYLDEGDHSAHPALWGKSDPINPTFIPTWQKGLLRDWIKLPPPTPPHTPTPSAATSWLGLDKNAQRWMASNWGGDTVHHHYDNSDNSTTYHNNQKTNVTVTGATEPHEIARAVGSTLDMAFSPSQAKQRFLQGAIS